MIRFVFSHNYNHALERIEDYIFATTESLEPVESFLDEHDGVLRFIEQNPTTPPIHPVTGDQSWIFGDGRYRLFFKIAGASPNLVINMVHLIDNREVNESVYPANKIPTYDE